jgi:hypothetical protein
MQYTRVAIVALSLVLQIWAGGAVGIWKVNPARSTIRESGIDTVEIRPHKKGEVFTLNQFDREGRATTSSTILYFDGRDRDIQDFGCSGTQSSRRIDELTVEIIRSCAGGEQIRLVRRLSELRNQLILEITREVVHHRIDERLVLERR